MIAKELLEVVDAPEAIAPGPTTPAGESAVRAALKAWLSDANGAGGSVWIDEFWVPLSYERADLVGLGDRLEAFEIKTARDRLTRLPRQVDAFSRVFDQCTAVVAREHQTRAMELLPRWWGLSVIVPGGDNVSFEVVRHPERNEEVDGETLVRLLWKKELNLVLRRMGLSVSESLAKASLRASLLELVDSLALRDVVRNVLIQRDPSSARIATRRFRSFT